MGFRLCWFRIRCQNWKRTYGYGDTAAWNFAIEIFPNCTFDRSGGSFICWFRIRCQNLKIMQPSGDIRLLTLNLYFFYTFTCLWRDQYMYIHIQIHTNIYIHTGTYIYTHTYIHTYIHAYTNIHTRMHSKQEHVSRTFRTMDDSLGYSQSVK